MRRFAALIDIVGINEVGPVAEVRVRGLQLQIGNTSQANAFTFSSAC
jgi:hypothetical protein